MPREAFAPLAHRLADRAAVEHLLAVAAGLRSPVLGEAQIAGQVRDAAAAARRGGAAGPVLSALFRSAARAAGRVRGETAIGRHPVSVGHAAAALALGARRPAATTALVVGAGEMARRAALAFRDRGVARVLVVNRGLERGRALAAEARGAAHSWDELPAVLALADVVVSATAASRPVITRTMVAGALDGRPGRPLDLVDVALPRDVEEGAGELTGARLWTIDDVASARDASLAERQRAVPRARAIVAEEVDAFLAWRRERAVAPTIVDVRARAEAIRRAELDRFLARPRAMATVDAAQIDYLTRSIVNKLLHPPTVRLKGAAVGGDGDRYAAVARDLFGLGDERGAAATPADRDAAAGWPAAGG